MRAWADSVGILFCATLLGALLWDGPIAAAQNAPQQASSIGEESAFRAFLETLWPQALARGVSRDTFDQAFAGVTEDLSAPAALGEQPEFERLLSAYFTEAVSATRITRGHALAGQYQSELADIERRYGVPRAILLAAWGMESDFGRLRGGKDIIRSLATLAFRRNDRDLFVEELLNALVLLQKGAIPRDKLRGSWAGAMGDPQFLPSAFLKYAVSYSGDGFADIWNRPADTLASIGNFLSASGWNRALPWDSKSLCRRISPSRPCTGIFVISLWQALRRRMDRPCRWRARQLCFCRPAPAARLFS